MEQRETNERYLSDGRGQTILIGAFAVLIAMLIIFLIAHTLNQKDKETISRGLKALQELEGRDIDAIDEKIAAQRESKESKASLVKEEEIAADAETLAQMKELFSDTIIMGDSIAEGLRGYDVLDYSTIIAFDGSQLGNSAYEIDVALERNPANIVLDYGLSDVSASTPEEFKNNYIDVVQKIRQTNPQTNVYICSVLPVAESVVETDSYYANIPAFNQAIREVCEQEGVTFIDTADLVSGYDEDGIHPSYEFFQKWAIRMLEVLQLTGN